MKSILLSTFVLVAMFTHCQNRSLHFDGTDDEVLIGNVLNISYTDAFSIEAWIRTTSNTGVHQIFSKIGSGLRVYGLQIENGILTAYLIHAYPNSALFTTGSSNIADDS